MNTFRFTDNRPIHKYVLTLDAAQLAAHLAKDAQFMFYWRKGWDPRLAAIRSINFTPPNEKAAVCPHITEEQWPCIETELLKVP